MSPGRIPPGLIFSMQLDWEVVFQVGWEVLMAISTRRHYAR